MFVINKHGKFKVSGPHFPEIKIENECLNTGEELRKDTNDLTNVDCRIIRSASAMTATAGIRFQKTFHQSTCHTLILVRKTKILYSI